MKKSKITISTIIAVFMMFFMFQACGGDDNKKDMPEPEPEPEPTESEITIDANKTFSHPGLLHSQTDFDRIKTKVEGGLSPWIEGWGMLINNSHSSLSYIPSPVVKLIRGGNSTEEPEADNYSTAFNDVAAAYQCAIRWKITGDDAYAEKAIEILNAWSSKCEIISGDSNIALAAGIYGYQFANAAEIMRAYEGWPSADFEAFKQWMLDVFYPISHDFLIRHNGTCISHYWANWDLAQLANVMAIGVLTDDAAIYNEALEYLLNGLGNGQLKKAIYFIHPTNENEPEELGQMQESGRDQGHAQLCIGLLGTICEMAWHQGDDLYGYDDNRVLKGAEYTAKYNFSGLSVPFEPYNNCENWSSTVISDDGKGGLRPIWARLYNHYAKRKGLTATYVELAKRVHNPEGGGGDYGPNSGGFDNLGFGTLMYSLE